MGLDPPFCLSACANPALTSTLKGGQEQGGTTSMWASLFENQEVMHTKNAKKRELESNKMSMHP